MVKEGYKEVRLGAKQIEVPKSWYVEFLGNIANFKQGTQVPVDEQKYKKTEGYVRFLRIVDYTQNTDDVRYIEHPGKKYIVDKDEIIMVRYGEAGLVCRGFNGVIANNLFKIDINTDLLDKTFSYFFLKQDKVYNYLSSLRLTSAMPAINFGIVSNLKILIPSLSEQKKIASILSSVDKSIEKTDEVIEETKELKKGLMQELLTKGIGHSEFKDTILGKIPAKWDIKQLRDICNKVTDGTHDTPKEVNDGYPFITAKNITNGKLDFKDCGYVSEKDHKKIISRSKPEKGDILFTHIGTIGQVVEVNVDFEFSIKNVALFKPDNELIISKYFKYSLQSNIVQGFIKRILQGGVQQYLGLTTLRGFNIPVPPLEEQKKIASILSSADAKIQKEEEYKSKLERLKKGLMQKLLTGEIRVNTEMEV